MWGLLMLLSGFASVTVPAFGALRRPLTKQETIAVYASIFEERGREYARLSEAHRAQLYAGDRDIVWKDAPGAWHQQVARIVDHRFKSFDAMYNFVTDAKKAGVGAVMLVQIQNTTGCPGPWYNGLQLCNHINGSYPVVDGTLEQWKRMLQEIKPMRLMWWNNPVYWSVQGQVWAEAKSDKSSSVGKFFSWGPESCDGIPQCDGSNVVVPGVGCAQGSWGSLGSNPKTEGVQSALASVGSKEYADYMVDAMSNTWTGNLGIDGYTEDCSCNYKCMLQLTDPEQGSLPDWARITKRVRAEHPQLVMSGEGYGSWAEMMIADANLGGQGSNSYHIKFQAAVTNGDASDLEDLASTSGADAASVLCYLNPHYDGQQPGGCPTMYFRDMTATMKDIKQYRLWVALEAASGIVSQHDYDPESSCAGWTGCEYWSHGKPGAWYARAQPTTRQPLVPFVYTVLCLCNTSIPSHSVDCRWNVTNDPFDPTEKESPLWAFQKYRALNRLALRTKLNVTSAVSVSTAGATASSTNPSNYTQYLSANCYNGNGGKEMDHGASIIAPTAADCTAHCDNSSACDCVTYCAEKSGDCAVQGLCWRRTSCDERKFERDAATKPFSVFVKKHWDPPAPPPPPPNLANGALVYLKHDSLGPKGDAAIMIFNPGKAQTVTVDLSVLPPKLLGGDVVPYDLFNLTQSEGPEMATVSPLLPSWTVQMAAGEMKAYGGFSLGTFAPRVGKKASCTSTYSRPLHEGASTLQQCFLQCLSDVNCENVFVNYVDIIWMEKPAAVTCMLLGAVDDPSRACKPGTGTLIKKLEKGRPSGTATHSTQMGH